MGRIQSLRQKEVINLRDGMRLGCVSDIEVDTASGCVAALIVPGPCRFFGLFGGNELYIKWCSIKKIGVDMIIVDVDTDKCVADQQKDF